ncbi:hypothetical protein GUITHDRAFT_122012 [Guillardia theta CCMP2712]|uniref:DUF2723 domain-containing protein n=1 Tax=Guillardia theta (strain CCMP2712) TaxID=905079 RepID=L1I7E7_GUITC|nr:hypothetical protein GUITHDRAFT_122012 [Guillardia theta CCMP2712]EKX31789.1 hypothetical protein GUITHDRAFT_122012 [Guillardia theta CCMP2712]|eukprot:XP_005818769.1 hypothetical protein GUITHDRAFT_122012 [Guillardia theta CCMP2712]
MKMDERTLQVATCCNLGVAHPPGYPLHTILGAIFVRAIPYGSPAFRVNLLSALSASIAAGFFSACQTSSCELRSFSQAQASMAMTSSIVRAWSAFSFAFSPLVWTYATHAEVFAMNNMFVAVLLFLHLRFALTKDPKGKKLMIECGNRGQSMTAIISDAQTAAMVIGLGSWGATDSMEGLIRHVLRSEYGTFRLYSGDDQQVQTNLTNFLVKFGWELLQQTHYVGVLLAVVGFFYLFTGGKKNVRDKDKTDSAARCEHVVAKELLYLLSFYLLVFGSLSNLPDKSQMHLGVLKRFWMQANLVVSVFIGDDSCSLNAVEMLLLCHEV